MRRVLQGASAVLCAMLLCAVVPFSLVGNAPTASAGMLSSALHGAGVGRFGESHGLANRLDHVGVPMFNVVIEAIGTAQASLEESFPGCYTDGVKSSLDGARSDLQTSMDKYTEACTKIGHVPNLLQVASAGSVAMLGAMGISAGAYLIYQGGQWAVAGASQMATLTSAGTVGAVAQSELATEALKLTATSKLQAAALGGQASAIKANLGADALKLHNASTTLSRTATQEQIGKLTAQWQGQLKAGEQTLYNIRDVGLGKQPPAAGEGAVQALKAGGWRARLSSIAKSMFSKTALVIWLIIEVAQLIADYHAANEAYGMYSDSAELAKSGCDKLIAGAEGVLGEAENMLSAAEGYGTSSAEVAEVIGSYNAADDLSASQGMTTVVMHSFQDLKSSLEEKLGALAQDKQNANLAKLGAGLEVLSQMGFVVLFITNASAEQQYETTQGVQGLGTTVHMAGAQEEVGAATPAAAVAYGFAKRSVDTARYGIKQVVTEIRDECDKAADLLGSVRAGGIGDFTRSGVDAFESAIERIPGATTEIVVKFDELFGGVPADRYAALSRSLSAVGGLLVDIGGSVGASEGYELTPDSEGSLTDAAVACLDAQSILRAVATGCASVEADMSAYVGDAVSALEMGIEAARAAAEELSGTTASAADGYITSAEEQLAAAVAETESGDEFRYCVKGLRNIVHALALADICSGAAEIGDLIEPVSATYDRATSMCSAARADGISTSDEEVLLDAVSDLMVQMGGEPDVARAVSEYDRATCKLDIVLDILGAKVQVKATEVESAYVGANDAIESGQALHGALVEEGLSLDASSLDAKVNRWAAIVGNYDQYFLREGNAFGVDTQAAPGHMDDMLRDFGGVQSEYEGWVAANASQISPILDGYTTVQTYYPQGIRTNNISRVVVTVKVSNPYNIPLDTHRALLSAPAGYSLVSVRDSRGGAVQYSAEPNGILVYVPLSRASGAHTPSSATVVYDAVVAAARHTGTVQADDAADGEVMFTSNYEVTCEVDADQLVLELTVPSATVLNLLGAAVDNKGNILDARPRSQTTVGTIFDVTFPSIRAGETRDVFLIFFEPAAVLDLVEESTETVDTENVTHSLVLRARNVSSLTFSPVRLFYFIPDRGADGVTLTRLGGEDITVSDIFLDENAGVSITFEVERMLPGAGYEYMVSYRTSNDEGAAGTLLDQVRYWSASTDLALLHARNVGLNTDAFASELSEVERSIADAELDIGIGRYTSAVVKLRAATARLEGIFWEADSLDTSHTSITYLALRLGNMASTAGALVGALAIDERLSSAAESLNATIANAEDAEERALEEARNLQTSSALSLLSEALDDIKSAYDDARESAAQAITERLGALQSAVEDMLLKIRLIGRCGGRADAEATELAAAVGSVEHASSLVLGGDTAGAIEKLSLIEGTMDNVGEGLERKSRTVGAAVSTELLAKIGSAATSAREALALAGAMDRSDRVSAEAKASLLSTRRDEAVAGVEDELVSLGRTSAAYADMVAPLGVSLAWLEEMRGELAGHISVEDYWAVLDVYDNSSADVSSVRSRSEERAALARACIAPIRDLAADRIRTARAAIDGARPALGARERAALEEMYGELARKFSTPPQAYADIAAEAADLAFFAEDLAVGRLVLPTPPAEGVPMWAAVIVAALAALAVVVVLARKGKIRIRRPRGGVPAPEIQVSAPLPSQVR